MPGKKKRQITHKIAEFKTLILDNRDKMANAEKQNLYIVKKIQTK